MAHDIAGLEQKVKALHEAESKLHDAEHAKRLLAIIHRPGWTSVAEFELVQAHMASLHHQIRGIHEGLDALVTIAEKIGNK
jgi:hypothetical protein